MTRVPPATAEVRRAVRAALEHTELEHTALEHTALEHAAPPGVVVACSGGADSLALAAAAAHVGAARGTTVHGLVVDHGLQPGSDTRAGEALAMLAGLGVDARVATVTVTEDGDGPEAAARRARYVALREESLVRRGAPVLLGHTLDDQAETVLLGLGRGSGARSLAGMRAWDPPWCRPLLGVRRATTRAACDEAGLTPWDDPHNLDPRYTRVRLRHEVLPLLEDVLAGGVAEALARTAGQLADDDAALDSRAHEVLATAADDDGGLDTTALVDHPAAVRRRVLRAWLTAAGVRGYDDAHLRSVDALVVRWRGQGPPSLPGGLEVTRVRGRLAVRLPPRGPGAHSR
jgi:tRNA(Ile)-lysidine synthase